MKFSKKFNPLGFVHDNILNTGTRFFTRFRYLFNNKSAWQVQVYLRKDGVTAIIR